VVLAVRSHGLSIGYEVEEGLLWVVDGLSVEVGVGESYCLVGESGCGKSTIGNAIAGLLPPYAVTDGVLELMGVRAIEGRLRRFNGLRGRVVARIPQDPAASLNPFLTVGEQLVNVLRAHLGNLTEDEARRRVEYLLNLVKLPTEIAEAYPHQLSGGMKQRVAIALALAPSPKVVVADEPTSALDAYLKFSIARLLKTLRSALGLTLVFITHDISLARYVCDRVAVIYAGRVVEEARTGDIVEGALHPYTKLLLRAVPRRLSSERLADIPGAPPPPGRYPPGCRFRPRCPIASEECTKDPEADEVGEGHRVYCWRWRLG
jgi:oligopeptide/dipeptide ABC transporter ATP-binding protein